MKVETIPYECWMDDIGVWSVGSKPVGRKCKNDKAEIFRQKAENRKAENTVRPKNEANCLLTLNIPSDNKLSIEGLLQ